MIKVAKTVLNLRWLIITIVALLTLFFAYELRNIRINPDIISSLPDDDPAAKLYKDIGKEFGGNEIGIVVIESDNIFKPDLIRKVQQITDSIKYMPGISTVTSLTNIIDIKSTEEGIEVGNLIDEYNLPQTQSELDSLKHYVFSKEMYVNSIVSEDATATAIIYTILPEQNKQKIAEEIRNKVAKLNLKENVYYGGLPSMMIDLNNMIVRDVIWLTPIVIIVISLILLFSFRTFVGVLLPLLTAMIAVVWTMGLMSILGYELTIISNVIPVVLLAVGSAYSIYVINSAKNTFSENKKENLSIALSKVIIPIILASVTTAIGFISFIFGAYLKMIKDFGVFTAIGTLIALILSIVLVPALLSIIKVKKLTGEKVVTDKSLTQKFLFYLTKIIVNYPRFSFFSWILVIVLCFIGISRIETNANLVDYFKKGNQTRKSEDLLQKKFGGSMPVFVLFEGDIQDPKILKLIDSTETYMKKNPYVKTTQSIANLIKQMNEAMGEGNKLPDERAKVEQLWFLLEGHDILSQLVNKDLNKAVIQSKFASVKTKDIEEFNAQMNEFINKNKEFKIKVTGMPSIYSQLNNSLLRSQFNSILIAMLLVIIFISLILVSVKQGLISVIPVIATTLVFFGFMGFVNIPLDVATVLVASLAIGIGIDYSIHIITGFNQYFKETLNTEKAIEKVVTTTGKAILINISSVASGFLVLLFAQIVPLQHFGLLIAITMFGAGFGAMTLLPTILLILNKKRNKSNGI